VLPAGEDAGPLPPKAVAGLLFTAAPKLPAAVLAPYPNRDGVVGLLAPIPGVVMAP
jgi:hypothetical protein